MIELNDLKSLPTPLRIGRRIVGIRSMRGISQHKLADMCGISNSTLNSIENGKSDFRISIIEKIERVLNCSLILVPNEDLI